MKMKNIMKKYYEIEFENFEVLSFLGKYFFFSFYF